MGLSVVDRRNPAYAPLLLHRGPLAGPRTGASDARAIFDLGPCHYVDAILDSRSIGDFYSLVPHGHRYVQAGCQRHVYQYAYRHDHAHTDHYLHTLADRYGHPHSDSYRHGNRYQHDDRHQYGNTDTYWDMDPERDAIAHRHA